jgi:hypothetical protein
MIRDAWVVGGWRKIAIPLKTPRECCCREKFQRKREYCETEKGRLQPKGQRRRAGSHCIQSAIRLRIERRS